MVVKNQNSSLGKVSCVAYGSDLSNAPGPLPLNLTANRRKLGKDLEMRLERGVGLELSYMNVDVTLLCLFP